MALWHILRRTGFNSLRLAIGCTVVATCCFSTVYAAVPGDITGDSRVDVIDLSAMLSQFGATGAADLNNSGTVDVIDLSIFLSAYRISLQEYPALPDSAALITRDDFESGTVGQSYTSNQCEANNNQVISSGWDAKIWETSWDAGDPPVAAHQARCELPEALNEPGEYIYRYKFKVPSESYLPGEGWHYRLQFHGDNPSTSPPIAMFTYEGPTPDQFSLRFGAGDSSWFQTGWSYYPRDQWHTAQVRVKWSTDNTGWSEFHIDGQPLTTLSGTTRLNGKTLHASQGTPTAVYAKYGLDGGSLPTTGIRLLGYVAHFEAWSVN